MASSHKNHTNIFIDSADRDQIMYPNPATYIYKLPTSLRNIHSIEIMSFQMVATEGILNSSTSSFGLTVNGSTYIVPILYSVQPAVIADLVTILQNSLNAIVPATFTVSSSSLTNRLSITAAANKPFSLNVNESVARIFGFIGQNTQTTNLGTFTISNRGAGTCSSTVISNNSVLTGAKMVELSSVPYVLLFLNDYQRNTGSSTLAQTSYMAIPLESKAQFSRFVILNDEKEHKGRYFLDGDRIDSFSIRITRPDGSLYDFNGTDHQIVIKLTHEDQRNYLS